MRPGGHFCNKPTATASARCVLLPAEGSHGRGRRRAGRPLHHLDTAGNPFKEEASASHFRACQVVTKLAEPTSMEVRFKVSVSVLLQCYYIIHTASTRSKRRNERCYLSVQLQDSEPWILTQHGGSRGCTGDLGRGTGSDQGCPSHSFPGPPF